MDPLVQLNQLKQQVTTLELPDDVREKLQTDIFRVELILKTQAFSLEAERHFDYINFICSLPWNKLNQDQLELAHAKQVLNHNHFGLEDVKERILEFLSMLILNQQKQQKFKAPSLLMVGLVGSGKTSMAYSIAEVLGRPLIRIPFGGLGSATQLRGESRIKPDAEPGLILRALQKAKVKNPVILLDELDRVATEARVNIMGVLVELLDPEQNSGFLDHYVDIPFDLSQVLFVATANNTGNVATAVMDRLEVIEMPFYSDQQKIIIGKDYLLPGALKGAGLNPESIVIDPNLWLEIVRPLGFDGGIRSLKRNIDTVVRKIAKQVVEGQPGPYHLTSQNIGQYLNK